MSNKTDKCPVCDMSVKYAEYTCQYHNMYFHFCSEQCLSNFNARPGLYLQSSIKNAGELIKKRTLSLLRPLNGEAAAIVKSEIMSLMGIKEVVIESKSIHISYDLKMVNGSQIEELLSSIELEIKNNWLDRLKRRHNDEIEENELDNLVASPRACCNKTPH